MEQSEYLKNLMKRLQQASEPYHDHHDPSHTHSMTTIKFQHNEADSSYFHSKRDPQNNTQNNNQTYVYGHKEETPPHGTIMEGLEEAIDNKKTTRNNSALKFNPAKIRKRSEDKFDRELSRRSGSQRGKTDLVEVRDRLVDIVSFLNAKIDGNPEMMDIKKVVDMDFVKESVIPNQKDPRRVSIEADTNKAGLLYLPKFQLHDAKLVKSSQILNNLSQEQSKVDNGFLNLKNSFDKLNDINSSHSLHQHHERPKQQQQYHRPTASFNNRQNAHITYQPYQQLPQSPKQPLVYINGRLNNNASRNRIAFPPEVKQIRPLSEIQPVRYVQYPQFDRNSPYTSNNLSKATIPSTPSFTPTTLPISQNSRAFIHPPALNVDRPPTFRTIASRPLSTQRLSAPVQTIKFVSPPTQTRPALHQTQKLGLSSRILQQQLAQSPKDRAYQALKSSRLKKKTSPSQHFKQQPPVSADTPKRILTQGHQEAPKQQYARRAEGQLDKISPPKPYTKFSSTTENPFKASQTIMSSSKKSSKFKADITYDILRSIAQQSEQNQPSKNLQASGRSSGRMMSSVQQVTPVTDIPKMNKYLMSGSTKLKRKGIDVSSSKMVYMSQYSRQ